MLSLLVLSAQVQAKNKILGKQAPDFTATTLFPDGSVKDFHLHDHMGKKIVLYFYPMDNTPGCTKQAQNFRDGIAKLDKQGISLVGISCNSIESHKRFQKKYNLPYPLVSDSRLHRSIGKKYPGTVSFGCYKRKTFLINKQGCVFKIFDKVNIENQIEDILKAFEQEPCK
ncbi:hypothetical protein A3J41_02640 [candidate division TM6 bacterium RIFCSPHIGHO2_12_FULL_38_8]|nr:MAG: hypothetical protein A3J41_02640 [candidate division TM6 bacterium RIFCSPHIGHO2_12_FULL_38_8]